MIVRRILSFVFLLGIWAQAASACPETHIAPVPAQEAIETAVPAVSEDIVVIAGEHRCDCLAMTQGAQSAVSESSKSLLASYVESASAFPVPSNPVSVAPGLRTRASRFIAHHSMQPPYLLVPRLRQ